MNLLWTEINSKTKRQFNKQLRCYSFAGYWLITLSYEVETRTNLHHTSPSPNNLDFRYSFFCWRNSSVCRLLCHSIIIDSSLILKCVLFDFPFRPNYYKNLIGTVLLPNRNQLLSFWQKTSFFSCVVFSWSKTTIRLNNSWEKCKFWVFMSPQKVKMSFEFIFFAFIFSFHRSKRNAKDSITTSLILVYL